MKNIRIQWFVLFIMVLLLMGCGVQKNVDFKNEKQVRNQNSREMVGCVDEAKSFDSTHDFPYENMQAVSDEVYEVLKDAYGKMDFSVEFKGGNIEDNSEYIYAGLKRTEQEMKR